MNRRGPILEFVGDIPIANPYYSGELGKMTPEQLESRLEVLSAADPEDTDSDEAFTARMEEMGTVQTEIGRRRQGEKDA